MKGLVLIFFCLYSSFSLSKILNLQLDCIDRKLKNDSIEIYRFSDALCSVLIKCVRSAVNNTFISSTCTNKNSYYRLGGFTSPDGGFVNSLSYNRGKLLYTDILLKDGSFVSGRVVEGIYDKEGGSEKVIMSFKSKIIFFNKEDNELKFIKLETCKKDSLKFFGKCFGPKEELLKI